MQIKADTKNIMMSDLLKDHLNFEEDQLPEEIVPIKIEETQSDAINSTLCAELAFKGTDSKLLGIVRSILFGNEYELEIVVDVEEALLLVTREGQIITGVELQRGKVAPIKILGPLQIKAGRIQEINVGQNSCVLAIQFMRI